jgi:phosphoribosylformylglycinamidine cyclo-ligase
VKYKDAGVNIDVADKIVKAIGSKAKATLTESVLRGVGPFGAMYRLSPPGVKAPVLVSSIDGVGTKLKICAQLGAHEGAGYDIVSHCANDVLAEGARPLFVLDYIGASALDPRVIDKVADGMVKACLECGCALIGGETAELPGTYPEGEYELVACMLGVVDESKIVDGSTIVPGDVAIGLPSSGLHTNGYSLARKVLLELRGFALDERLAELRATVGEALLAPHRQYVRPVLPLVDAGLVKGIAHITGGGLPGNVSRILPKGTGLAVKRGAWEVPPIFRVIEREGEVAEDEMFRTFNMGVGLVLIVDAERAGDVARELEAVGEQCRRIGEVIRGADVFQLID